MKGFKIALAGLVFLFTTNTVSAAVITNAFMTDVVPTNCEDSLIPIVTTFYENDKAATFFVSFILDELGDTYQTKWYHEGVLYIEGDITTVDAASLQCMSRTMKIFGTETMNMPGTWQVQFYYNGQVLLQFDFELKERCAAQVALNNDSRSLNTLRAFRDQTLNKTRCGQKAVKLFYEYSPALVKAMEENTMLQASVRALLTACVTVINRFN